VKFRMRVKRDWDGACEKAEIAMGAVGIWQGKIVGVTSVLMTMSHVLELEFCELEPLAEERLPQIKFWLASMIRRHR
jgi:hypothetical protein